VRALRHAQHESSYPQTTSGILWPGGVSHLAVGNVTPTSITTALAEEQSEAHTVSLTLPATGALTNMVDVFLLFDDTGSFTANSPIVRAAFPQIISALTAAMPGVDFGFGVGRLEEYANFALENPTGRPFILNQPIIAASTPGFETAIQSALDRTAPGYGGDQPETDIEALYQVATGAGFDGNNNGTTSDSGDAGLVSTQLNPGSSGDVPAFGSFTIDPSGNVLPASGTIGGAGFRAGALPIILTATDTGFAFQPMGESSITGVNGLTLPIAAFTQTSRPTTPFAAGAGLQQTITALNALGALVIGLGTNGDALTDPRQGLEAVARLTGAVNRSLTTIPNGTIDPIAPGDPLYFQITSGFGASVANGIVTAIQNAVSNVSVNLSLKASDARVHLSFDPNVINNVGAGQTATFDVTFTGDGRPHRFDLQFVRAGTDVVLGSIPVVLGTPISGDGYEYIELEDGEIHIGDDFGHSHNSSLPANVAPTFVAGDDQIALEDSGRHTIASWASAISVGEGETDQLADFLVEADDASLFAEAPWISSDGTLSYTPAAGRVGVATVTVRLRDSGGTEGGGVDTSNAQSFTITINPALDISSTFEYAVWQGLTLDFSQDVAGALSAGDLQLANRDSGAGVELVTLDYDSSLRRATVRFAAPLPDGRYRLTINPDALPGLSAPHHLDFFVLAGDANHDAVLDADDYFQLDAGYAARKTGFANGDFDYKGVIDADDYFLLDQNYGSGAAALVTGGAVPARAAAFDPVFADGAAISAPSISAYSRLIEGETAAGLI
jgi:hypothetical protein